MKQYIYYCLSKETIFFGLQVPDRLKLHAKIVDFPMHTCKPYRASFATGSLGE
jgi:hypothetical protein